MKHQNSCGPSWGKLVHQLIRVVTFSCDLCFKRVITHWKGIFEKYTLCHQNMTPSTIWLWQAKRTLFRAPKRPWKYINMYWHENFQNKPVGIGGRPPISTWMLCRDSGQPHNCRIHNYNKMSPLQRNVLNWKLSRWASWNLEHVGGPQYPPRSVLPP